MTAYFIDEFTSEGFFPSFFFFFSSRPNCFQVVVRAFNESRMFYLCADTQDLANVRSLLICRKFIFMLNISEEVEDQRVECYAMVVSVIGF